MTKEDIIKSIDDLINTSGFTSENKLAESYGTSKYSLNANFKLELSNLKSINNPNEYSFKIENIEDITTIWVEITNSKPADTNEVLEDALTKFNIDKSQDIYLILKILK